ncbi:MAG: hypothetical protein KY475_20350 [Planctomycetes bacterium]|nr:hypothetical protein [Planctomycetota bacterium]
MYRGTVRHGVVVLKNGACLPEGVEVFVELASSPETTATDSVIMRNGFPVFPRRDPDLQPGLDLVKELRDDS